MSRFHALRLAAVPTAKGNFRAPTKGRRTWRSAEGNGRWCRGSSASTPEALIQFGLAAATLEEVAREAGQKLEDGRNIRRPLAQHDILPPFQNLHLLRPKTKPLGNPHGLAVSTAKNLGDRHSESMYEPQIRCKWQFRNERAGKRSPRPSFLLSTVNC